MNIKIAEITEFAGIAEIADFAEAEKATFSKCSKFGYFNEKIDGFFEKHLKLIQKR